MRVKEVIAASKVIVDVGVWKDGKMQNSAFPLSKSPLNVNAHYRWRCISFTCFGASFRLLSCYRLDLQKFSAYLGRQDDKNMTVLARYEWHSTHEGWHFHVPRTCDDSQQVPGRTGGCNQRLPLCDQAHRRMVFGVYDDDSAYKTAFHAFRLGKSSESFRLVAQ